MNNQVEFIKLTMKEKFLMIFYTVLAVLSFTTLIRSCEHEKQTDLPQQTIKANEVQVEAKRIEKAYRMQLTQLKIYSDSLEKKLDFTNKQLLIATKKVQAGKNQIAGIIEKYDTDTSLKKDAFAFDTLANSSLDFTKDVEFKDSLEVPVKLTHQGRSKLTRVIAGERCIKFIH